MSHNFLRFINLFALNKGIRLEPVMLLFTIPHVYYVLATQKEDNISIVNKYKYVSNGFTNFMIIDNKGNHYNVNNSFWFWKWDSIEDWNNLKVGNTIYAKYYGLRMPFLGCFPNIIDTNYTVKEKTKLDDEKYLISIVPVLTTNKDINCNNDKNRISRDVMISALATFK